MLENESVSVVSGLTTVRIHIGHTRRVTGGFVCEDLRVWHC